MLMAFSHRYTDHYELDLRRDLRHVSSNLLIIIEELEH